MPGTKADDTVTGIALAYGRRYAIANISEPDEHTAQVYRKAATWLRSQAFELQLVTGLHLRTTPNPEPFASAAHQAAYARQDHELWISAAHCDHQVWNAADNIAARYIHDVTAHAVLDTTIPPKDVPDFSTTGELTGWTRTYDWLQSQDAPRYVYSVLFSEFVGQTCYLHHYGTFPTTDIGQQPAILLPGLTRRIVHLQ